MHDKTSLQKLLKVSPFPSHFRFWEWTLLIVLFLVMRLGGLLLFHPMYNDMCPLEEYYRGALARILLDGLPLPYWEYRADNFGGGSLVAGLLAAGFFKLFGDSAFVLRSMSVMISLGTLLLWFRMIYREVSRKCAWYFALFFIFAPSFFQSYSMVPLGDHYETMFLSALGFWIFLDIQKNPHSILKIFILGLLCGFGIWFNYIFSLAVASLLIVWFIKNPKFFLCLRFWAFVPGFLLGFSPWIFLNLQHQFQGLLIRGVPLSYHVHPFRTLEYWLHYNWRNSFLYDLAAAFSHPDIGFKTAPYPIRRFYIGLLSAPAILLSYLCLKQKNLFRNFATKPISTVSLYFLFFGFLHLVAIELTKFEGERFMMPFMPVVFFAWAKTIESLESILPHAAKMIRTLLGLPVFVLGFFLWLSMISPAYAGFLLKSPGYAYDNLSDTPICYEEIKTCINAHKTLLAKVPLKHRRGIWISLAVKASGADNTKNPIEAFKKIGISDPEFATVFYFHFGKSLFYVHDFKLRKALASLKSFVDPESPVGKLCTLGIFRGMGGEALSDIRLISGDIPQEKTADYFRERGKRSARLWQDTHRSFHEIQATISDVFYLPERSKERGAFLQGLGSILIRSTYNKPITGLQIWEQVMLQFPPEDQQSFFQGVGRAYVISELFTRAPCQFWSHQILPPNQNPLIMQWIEEGKKQIRDLVEEFYSTLS